MASAVPLALRVDSSAVGAILGTRRTNEQTRSPSLTGRRWGLLRERPSDRVHTGPKHKFPVWKKCRIGVVHTRPTFRVQISVGLV